MPSTNLSDTVIDRQTREAWRAAGRREWSEAERVAAWRKWGRINIAAQRDATIALLEAAQVLPGMRVIDIAGGGGDPGLAAAATVGPDGHVTVTDISEGMLETARLFAGEDSLDNLDFHVADTEHLPFADQSFDRALCRCAVMFFPDPEAALREIGRVLKPDGRAAFLAWGALPANPLFLGVFTAIGKVLTLPQPPPGSPFPFRYATPGSLGAVLEDAGFGQVSEQTVEVMSQWRVSPEQFTELMVEVGGLEWLLSQMTDAQRADVLADITATYRGYQRGEAIEFPLSFVLATGVARSD